MENNEIMNEMINEELDEVMDVAAEANGGLNKVVVGVIVGIATLAIGAGIKYGGKVVKAIKDKKDKKALHKPDHEVIVEQEDIEAVTE